MPNHRRIENVALDENDRRLIDALDRNARTSIADLARLIGLSPQSTSDRVKRLEDLGVITGFTVQLDPAALGLGIGAYIRIRPAMGELQRVGQLLVDIPEIIECDRVTGEDCFVAKVFVARIDDLERVIDRAASLCADEHVDHPILSGPAKAALAAALAPSAVAVTRTAPPRRSPPPGPCGSRQPAKKCFSLRQSPDKCYASGLLGLGIVNSDDRPSLLRADNIGATAWGS